MQILSNKLLDNAARLAANAKDGNITIDEQTYTLRFNPNEWVYTVTDEAGETIVRFNTKRLGTAKAWLREYLAS